MYLSYICYFLYLLHSWVVIFDHAVVLSHLHFHTVLLPSYPVYISVVIYDIEQHNMIMNLHICDKINKRAILFFR